MKWAVLSWITLSAGQALAQHEARFWYFGGLGADMSTNPPLVLNNSAMWQLEGSSTICNPAGDLLFYSDGEQVWNRQHRVTPNGDNLLGSFTSTQSALFIPRPGNPDIFYLFTTDAGSYEDANIEGLRYSVVSLCADGGLGDVIASSKNTLLHKPSTEKMSATFHANGTDVWVVSHPLNGDEFFAYLVTENGVNPTPVRSQAGPFYPDANGNVLGQLKFSTDGTRLAMVTKLGDVEIGGAAGSVRVFNFDKATGVVTATPVKAFLVMPYGCEFSPDGSKLYVGYFDEQQLLQLDITGLPADPPRTVVYNNPNDFIGQLQLNYDGRIYTNGLSVIHAPNEPGLNCLFESRPFPTGGSYGLPNFIQNYFDPKPLIVHTQPCDGLFQFSLTRGEQVQSVQWSFGDPASGSGNTSGDVAPQHTFSAEGVYQITASVTLLSGEVLVRHKKVIWKTFEVNLGPDRVLCDQGSFGLDATQNDYACYRWQDGSTLPTYQATRTGIYWVDVRLGGCTKRDSVYLEFKNTPAIDLGPDRILCEGRTITFPANTDATSLLWSNGSTGPMITVSQPGIYWLRAANGPCQKTDTARVTLQLLPKLNLPQDTTFCQGTTLYLDARQPGVQYLWNNGKTSGDITIAEEGKYWVRATINGCPKTDTIRVAQITRFEKTEYDTLICEGKAVAFDFTQPETSYFWSTGSTDSKLTLTTPGRYAVSLDSRCWSQEMVIDLQTEDCNCVVQVPNVFSPNGDSYNEYFRPLWHQEVTDVDFRIVNRWGVEVFGTTSKDEGWRGQLGSEAASDGVYFWTARYQCRVAGEVQSNESKGSVMVVR